MIIFIFFFVLRNYGFFLSWDSKILKMSTIDDVGWHVTLNIYSFTVVEIFLFFIDVEAYVLTIS